MRFELDGDGVYTPLIWQVCFCKKTATHWLDRFLMPGFRHVFLLGFVGAADVWLLYDVGRDISTVAVVSRERARELFAVALSDGAVLRYEPAAPARRGGLLGRLGFWCAPAVAHALGLRCVAITPRGLHDYLLKIGASPLQGDGHVVGSKREPGTEA